MTAEIGWRCSALDFECDHRHLVDDSLINRQPVQAVQQLLGVGSSWHLEHDPSCVVLHTLKFLDGAGRSTIYTGERYSSRFSIESNYKPTSVLVPASGDVVYDGWLERGSCTTLLPCGVLLECQSPVQDDAKNFHLLRYWQVDPSDSQRWDGW